MNKPWQIWTTFVTCLAVITVVMGWLTVTTWQLDALRETDRVETEAARREAELQDRINSSLYRMDLMMLPIIAQEAARPADHYTAHVKTDRQSDSQIQQTARQARPLASTHPFVQLHFQIDSAGSVTSPQASRPLFVEFSKDVSYSSLLAMTSPDNLNATNDDFLVLLNLNAFSIPTVTLTPEDGFGDNKLAVQQRRGNIRANAEYNSRWQSTNDFANQQMANNSDIGLNDTITTTGAMSPVWVDEQLLLLRRVASHGEIVVQGCVLDWPNIRTSLLDKVTDLIAGIDVQPQQGDSSSDASRSLTTLPLQLVIDEPAALAALAIDSPITNPSRSGLRTSLLIAWCALGLAAFATAFLIQQIMRLSERRAGFVSAVTHELRTPLTTFRMYADMLAEEMVPADKQRHYAQTLRTQADRLSLLVENVLQFAKLERSPQPLPTETVTIAQMLERFEDRLIERAQQAELKIVTEVPAAVGDVSISTQPAAVEQIVFNLVDNACKYGVPSTSGEIKISANLNGGTVCVAVTDDGPGVSSSGVREMFRPFHKSDQDAASTAPGVGLGLALSRRLAQSIGGKLDVENIETGACFNLSIPI